MEVKKCWVCKKIMSCYRKRLSRGTKGERRDLAGMAQMGVLIVVDIFKHQRRYGKWNRSQIYYGPKSPFYFSPSWVVYHLPRFLSAIKISFMWRKSAKKCWINVQLEINVFMCVQLFKLGIFYVRTKYK